MLGKLDKGQNCNFERNHEQKLSPDGIGLTVHDRDVTIDM